MMAETGAGTPFTHSPGATGCLAIWQCTHSMGAEQLSCLSRGPGMRCTRPLLRWPGDVVFHQGIQDRQPLAHTGGPCDLGGLPRSPQVCVKRFAHRMRTDRHQGAHGPSGAHVSAPAPDRPAAPNGTAIAM